MSYSCYLKKSKTTGNPEFWAYEEIGSECNIAFGSMVSSGRQIRIKESGYGKLTLPRKIKDGYILAANYCTLDEIDEAKRAVHGSKLPLSPAAFSIYEKCMIMKNSKIDQSLSKVRNHEVIATPVIAVKPVIPKEIKTIALLATSEDAVSNPWDW